MQSADLIVVGAGVLGSFHAYFAAQLGMRVLLLERNALPDDASTRNFGMLPESIVDPLGPWESYPRASAEIYQAIQQRADITIETRGSLYVASTDLERAVLHEYADRFARDGHCRLIDATEVARCYPFVKASYCLAALLFPSDLSLNPRAMLAHFIPFLVESCGVRYMSNTFVTSVDSSRGHCVVRDSSGIEYAADTVLLCTGADFRTLYPDAFRESGLQICKLQMMRTLPLPQVRLPHSILSGLSLRRYPAFTNCPSYQLLLAEPVDNELRQFGIHLLFKQTDDRSIVVGDSHEYHGLDEPDNLRERTSSAVNEAILRYARTMIELPSWSMAEFWNGYYLVHPTEPAFTAEVDRGVHVVTGIGGKGMTTGPAFAQASIAALFP